MTALIHFHFKEEPETMERFAILWNRLIFVLEFKGELTTKSINIG
jgi:hypothetical protein